MVVLVLDARHEYLMADLMVVTVDADEISTSILTQTSIH